MKLLTIIAAFFMMVFASPSKEQIYVAKIKFIGDKRVSARKLRALIDQEQGGFFNKKKLERSLIASDSNRIINHYLNTGFLDASIDSIRMVEKSKDKVIEKFYLQEGQRYRIGKIFIDGNNHFPETELRELLEIDTGDYLEMKKVNETQLLFAQTYSNSGFLDARMELSFSKNPDFTVDLGFIIDEEDRLRVGEIYVFGNKKTKEATIKQAFNFVEDEWIHYDKVLQGQKRLYETGIFSSISTQFNVSPYDDAKRDINIKVRERKSGKLEFGGGYATVEGWRASWGVGAGNIRRDASRASLQFRASEKETRIGIDYTDPWIGKTQFQGDLGTGVEFKTEDTTRFDVGAGVSKLFGEFTKVTLGYKFEVSNKDTLGLINGALAPVFTRDTRNDYFETRRGRFLKIETEYASPYTVSDFHYVRGIFEARQFYSPTLKRTLALKLKASVVGPIVNAPYYVYIREGGDQSVRGFDKASLGPVEGGAASAISSLEIRQSTGKGVWFIKDFGIVFFLDAGVVSGNQKITERHGAYFGTGTGLRMSFALGVIRLDWAVPIEEPIDKQVGKLYFNLGQSF